MGKMEFIKASGATKAWEFWWDKLAQQAGARWECDSRDGTVVGEVLNAVTVITDPTRGIVQSKIRNMPMRYAVGELLWYLSGSQRLDDILRYSSVWDGLTDDGETVNSAYGYRIRYKYGYNQWDYVRELLKKDPFSRRAVIHIKDADNTPSKDVPCTCTLQFLIRGGELHLTVYMRSNDIWMGFPYDVFSFTSLQVLMAMELGVDIGEYTHIAGSLHLYERDWKKHEESKGTAPSGQ